MHPWSTERAMNAAESELSPPISPKQQAVLVGTEKRQRTSSSSQEEDTAGDNEDFVEPLQETNLRSYSQKDNISDKEDSQDTHCDSSNDEALSPSHSHTLSHTLVHTRSSSHAHSLSLSHSHPNSPYTHQQPHVRQRSRTITSNIAAPEPVPAGLLLSRLDISSSTSTSTSASVVSSASSSTTSLSSVSSKLSHTLSSADQHPHQHQYQHHHLQHHQVTSELDGLRSPSLQKLDINSQPPLELSLLDTPPSSHAISPSSPSYPTLRGTLGLNVSTTTTTMTTTTATKTTSRALSSKRTRAPWHCTKKSIPQIIRAISDMVDGRDKTIKVVQYFAKVFLWMFLTNPVQYKVLATRIKALAKQFSTTRKVLRLGHFVDPLSTVLTMAVALRATVSKHGLRKTVMTKPTAQTWKDTIRERLGSLNNVLGLVQDISDDIYCLGVIGVLDREFADKAEPWSNRLWMIGVTIDLHENLQTIRDVRKQLRVLENRPKCENEEEERTRLAQETKLRTKLHWLQVTTVKLGGDFLFCAYDNLHCSFSDGFQAVTGFVSGLAGAYKYVGKVMES
ncbi:hypothetical protein EDD11_006147 [Mortierella claussenii]|nr:hypothetical protein EDD11_006147 [Mortierella claussenii]